jgi:hypothetical protein
MAQRYGGKHSPGAPGTTKPPASGRPGAQPDWHARRPGRATARANLTFFFPVPFAIAAFAGDPANLLVKLGAVACLVLAAWLTREGLRAEEAYDARTTARRPAIPRKLFGAVATGLGLAMGGWAGAGLTDPAIFAVTGAALHVLAFGLDPMKDKGLEGVDSFQTDRVARAVDEAERHLADMAQAIRGLGDRALADRMTVFQGNVRDMLRTLEDDPRGLTAARRYLAVYLLGARDATVKFAGLYGRSRDAAARRDYEALLDDLDRNFTARTQALRAGDRTALEIEMEVLRDRLAREGVRAED